MRWEENVVVVVEELVVLSEVCVVKKVLIVRENKCDRRWEGDICEV